MARPSCYEEFECQKSKGAEELAAAHALLSMSVPDHGKIQNMTDQATRILEEALKLPPEARAAIAGRLMESLDEHVDEDAEAAWAEEIARRLKEGDSGKVAAIPWAEARRQILGEGDGPGNR